MVEIIAAQHFFSTVSASESPSGRRGYQTLFRTQGLPDAASKIIEDRAQYNARVTAAKHQYYPLPGNLYALSHLVPLQERDEFGRKGRYLAHTLVLTSQSMAALAYCPLDVLRQFAFATTLDTVYSQGDPATGQVPAVGVSVQQAWHRDGWRALQAWPYEAWKALGLIAWHEAGVDESAGGVALLGPEKDRWATLAAIFLLAAARQRSELSFDTLADGCRWADPHAFWISSFADEREVATSFRIHADQRTTSGILPGAPQTPYVTWMLAEGLGQLSRGRDISREQAWALSLQDVLRGVPPGNREIDGQFVISFAGANSRRVAERWMGHLPSQLSDELVISLSSSVHRGVGRHLRILLEGVKDTDLDIFLFDELLTLGQPPSRPDQRAIKRWASEHDTPRLDALDCLWARDGRAWPLHISNLEPTDYQQLATQLSRWPEPPLPLWTMLVDAHAERWIGLIAPVLPPDEWRKALPILRDLSNIGLDGLAPVARQLSVPARQEIVNWLKRSKATAEKLSAYLVEPQQPGEERRRRWWQR